MTCENCDPKQYYPGKIILIENNRSSIPFCRFCKDEIETDPLLKGGIRMSSNNGWDEYFHAIAMVVSGNSKCMSRKVGAVLTRNNAIISTGYNGPPRGIPKCRGSICPRQVVGFKSGEGLHLCPATHAEANSIAQAAMNGVSTSGASMYLTCGVPCKNCLALIINAGIAEVVCTSEEYYDNLSEYILENSDLIVRVYEHLEEA